MQFDFSEVSIRNKIKQFIEKKPGDGKKGPFFNSKSKWVFDTGDKELFEMAVWQGYLDASRTFVGIKNTKNCQKAFCELAASIQEYFKGKSDFEHSKWCNDFIDNVFKYNGYRARFGQAQKVVNMAFKYLYCCDGAERYQQKFNLCHMPLDQYTLAWLFTEGGNLYIGWSYFDETSYNEAQKEIKNILGENVLEKEFVIWEELQKKYIDLEKLYHSRS